MPEAVLDAMQVLDEIFALERRALEQRGDLGARGRIDTSPRGGGSRTADLGNGNRSWPESVALES